MGTVRELLMGDNAMGIVIYKRTIYADIEHFWSRKIWKEHSSELMAIEPDIHLRFTGNGYDDRENGRNYKECESTHPDAQRFDLARNPEIVKRRAMVMSYVLDGDEFMVSNNQLKRYGLLKRKERVGPPKTQAELETEWGWDALRPLCQARYGHKDVSRLSKTDREQLRVEMDWRDEEVTH